MKKVRSLRVSPSLILLLFAIIAYAIYFSYLTLVRYQAFEARALDLGNLDQAVWNTAHGRPFHLTNQPGITGAPWARLSLHVEPILIPISWLYWVYSGPPTLLVLQASVVALGAWPLFALAKFKLGNEWLALLFGLAFLLNPTIQAANWYEFHPVTLAPTFLIATFYFLVTGRTGWYSVFGVLAASCKEEMALLVFMLGLYAFVVLRRRRLGLVTMILSLAWALIAVLVIQQTFAAGNIHWGRYAWLGETPPQIVLTLLTRPDLVLAQLIKAEVLHYLFLLLLPVGFLALLAPEILLLALPSFGINLLSDYPPMRQVNELMYAAPIAPFVLMGAVYGMLRITCYGLRVKTARTTHYIVGTLLVACLLYAHVRYSYLPGGGNHRLYTITEHHRRAETIIAQIPPAAKVSAQDRLNPHVSGRETVYIFPQVENADTVFLDVTGPAWPQHPNDLRRSVDNLFAAGFGVAAAEDGYLLLRQGLITQTLPAAFYDAWRRPQFAPEMTLTVDFDDRVRLLAYEVTTDSHNELVTKFYWQLLKPIDDDLRFYVGYLDRAGNVLHDTLFYPPVAELWYPTSQWQVSEPTLVQTLPWTLNVDRFGLFVGLFTGENGWQTGGRLRITGTTRPLPLFENKTLIRLGGYQRGRTGAWQPILTGGAPPATPLAATFGDQIVLEGVTLPERVVSVGAELPFTLHWRAIRPPLMDYSVFAHLLDSNGNKVAQLDWQPQDIIGKLPVTTWMVGEPVVDKQVLALPTDLPPGSYQLGVGLYNWQDGQRLAVTEPGLEIGDIVMIGKIEAE